MQIANRDQGIHSLFQRLANPNQNSSRKRNSFATGVLDNAQALVRIFVGSVIMGGIFVICVLIFRRGVVGEIQALLKRGTSGGTLPGTPGPK